MDIGRILLVLIGAGLFAAYGPAHAETRTEAPPVETPVWGDPEEEEDTDDRWTWFGMGYERRNRMWDQVADPLSETEEAPADGKGKHGR